MMQSEDATRYWIEEYKKQRPAFILDSIKEGDYIVKGSDYFIHVDNFRKVISTFSASSGINLRKIREHFTQQHSKSGGNKYYDNNGYDYKGKKCLDLSHLIDNHVGECTEMSIVVKILTQIAERESYWISAFLCEKGDFTLQYHAFVIAFKKNKPYVLDAAWIQALEILDLKEDESGVEIIVDEKSPIEYFF